MAKALGLGDSGKSERELATRAVERVKELLVALGAPRRLPWETIPSAELEEITRLSLGKPPALNNPRRPSQAEMIALFEKTLEGWDIPGAKTAIDNGANYY